MKVFRRREIEIEAARKLQVHCLTACERRYGHRGVHPKQGLDGLRPARRLANRSCRASFAPAKSSAVSRDRFAPDSAGRWCVLAALRHAADAQLQSDGRRCADASRFGAVDLKAWFRHSWLLAEARLLHEAQRRTARCAARPRCLRRVPSNAGG